MKIGASRLAPKFQTGLSWSFSTNSSLEIELTPVVSEIVGQPRRLGLVDAVERGGDAALGGDDVGPALEQLRRQPGRDGVGLRRQLRADGGGAGRIAADQELERPERLLARQLDLPQRVAVGPDVARAT